MTDIKQVLDEIIWHIQMNFRLRIIASSVLDKGWLNVKWRIMTDHGSFFIKYYHPSRYKLHLPDRRAEMEKTLVLQQRLHESGLACPQVHGLEGKYIQETHSGYLYVMMAWVEGCAAEAGMLNTHEMYDLGQVTGRMHQVLRQIELGSVAWKPDQTACLVDLHQNLEQAKKEESHNLVDLLELAKRNVQSLDFTIFNESPIGWTHWDLWVDNLLLDEHGIAGIVDFDRMAVAYPEIDVARAILSGAFDLMGIRMDAVQAFLTGYRVYSEAPKGLILRSFQMLYLIESTWWLQTNVLLDTDVPQRFFEELKWLTKNWNELPEMFADV